MVWLIVISYTHPLADILLSWSPVTTTFDGGPVDLLHYELYGSNQPFTRADIRDGVVGGPLTTATGTSIDMTPMLQSRYYSVLAVDTRGNKSPF